MNLFFYKTNFDIGKNGVYENLKDYLNSLNITYQLLDYKYIEPALTVTVKLPINSHQFKKSFLGDYCMIQDDVTYYYYVMNSKWRGAETLEVTLGLDTLNTFWSTIKNTLTSETHITRRFKDRWKIRNTDEVYPVVDSYPESFSTLPMKRVNNAQLVSDAIKWYLVYFTKYDQSTSDLAANPVSCYCLPEKAIAIKSQTEGIVTWTQDTFGENIAFGITSSDSAGAQFRIGSTTVTISAIKPNSMVYIASTAYILYSTEYQKYYLKYFKTQYSAGTATTSMVTDEGTSVEFISCDKAYIQDYDLVDMFTKSDTARWPREGLLSYDAPYEINAGSTYNQLMSFESWYANNKTDARLVKIRELPYAPFKQTYDSSTGTLNIPDDWILDANILKFKGNAFNEYALATIQTRYLPEFDIGVVAADEPSISDETKLFSSDFSTYKIVYDTNSWTLQPEKLDLTYLGADVTVSYKVSDGMDNGLGFKFEVSGKQQYDTDFGEYMIVDRSTDLPYFTNEYLNYMRYGKAIDEKQAGWNVASSVVGGLGGIATTAASLAFGGSVIQGAAAGGAIGAIVGAAVGVVTAAIAISKTASTA